MKINYSEWRVGFMAWIDSLPYAEDLLIGS